MSLRTLLTIIGITLIVKGVTMYVDTLDIDDEGIACTMDAKLCYDGSAVGRSGPDCTFDPCPGDLGLFIDPMIGISFGLPEKYTALQDTPQREGSRLYSIVLIDKDAGTPPPDSEGPPAITVDVYTRDSSVASVEQWIRGNRLSNFHLSQDATLTQTEVGGIAGFLYSWDGLYTGESIALLEGNRIFVFSVTYLSPEDTIRSDFRRVVETVRFGSDIPF